MIRIEPRDAYWPFYCEENVWRLIEELPAAVTDVAAVYISNPGKRVAIWGQRIASTPEAAVIWDYHVIMIVLVGGHWQAVDLDSVLPLQLPVEAYLDASFPADEPLSQRYPPLFRVIDGAEYRLRFKSDRRHMRRPDGGWKSDPPPHPMTSHTESNVMEFADMEQPFMGEVMDLAGLRAWVAAVERP